jgi:hypothetical protein
VRRETLYRLARSSDVASLNPSMFAAFGGEDGSFNGMKGSVAHRLAAVSYKMRLFHTVIRIPYGTVRYVYHQLWKLEGAGRPLSGLDAYHLGRRFGID